MFIFNAKTLMYLIESKVWQLKILPSHLTSQSYLKGVLIYVLLTKCSLNEIIENVSSTPFLYL